MSNLLENLLRSADSLQSSSNNEKNNLTFQQCALVHEALLDASYSFAAHKVTDTSLSRLLLDITESSNDPDSEGFILQKVTAALLDEDMIQTVHRVLITDTLASPTQVLITVQFLLRLILRNTQEELPFTSIVLLGVDLVLLPILFNCSHLKLETVDIIIDATFCQRPSLDYPKSSSSAIPTPVDLQLLQRTTTHLIKRLREALACPLSHPSSTIHRVKATLEWGSRIYSKINLVWNATFIHQSQDSLLDPIHQTILDTLTSIFYYTNTPLLVNGRLELIRPITAILLPILYPMDRSPSNCDAEIRRISTLWTLIRSIIMHHHIDAPKQEPNMKHPCQHSSMVANSIVTSILSICASTPAWNRTKPTNSLPFLPLNEQPMLWNFILVCLSKAPSDMGGKTSTRIGLASRAKKKVDIETVDDELGPNDTSLLVDQVVRRRALYILRLFIDALRTKNRPEFIPWIKFVTVFESLEMETEIHLVDQSWPTIIELCSTCIPDTDGNSSSHNNTALSSPPPLTWSWMSALLARVILSDSPTIKKFALFRFLTGNTGIEIYQNELGSSPTASHQISKSTVFMAQPQKKSNIKEKTRGNIEKNLAPVSILTPSFVLSVIIRGFNSLGASCGTGINYENDGKIKTDDLKRYIGPFLTYYVQGLQSYPQRIKLFFVTLLSVEYINHQNIRTINLDLVLTGVCNAWSDNNHELLTIPIEIQTLEAAVSSFRIVVQNHSTLPHQRASILRSFAIILSHCNIVDSTHLDAFLLLRTFSLFSFVKPDKTVREEMDTYQALLVWLQHMGMDWVMQKVEECAILFLSGDLLLDHNSSQERELGLAITLLCSLAGELLPDVSAAALLWPAINEGLRNHETGTKARALILLEGGCYHNGSLSPPPPNIDDLLSICVSFVIDQIKYISSLSEDALSDNLLEHSSVRSSACRALVDMKLSSLIKLCILLRHSFPSNALLSSSMSIHIRQFLLTNLRIESMQDTDLVLNSAVCFAYLSLGEFQVESHMLLKCCWNILDADLRMVDSSRRCKVMRSIFHYAKWGILSRIIPRLNVNGVCESELIEWADTLWNKAKDSVTSTPLVAMLPLFDAVSASVQAVISTRMSKSFPSSTIQFVIETLSYAIADTNSNNVRMNMLETLCSIIFRGHLLLDEYRNSVVASDTETFPIRAFFRLLITQSSTKPYIAKIALCFISAAWLFFDEEGSIGRSETGMSAIMYRSDICQLLIGKEADVNACVSIQESLVENFPQERFCLDGVDRAQLPLGIHDMSIARGFLLVFLSKLPDAHEMSNVVLHDLCFYIIRWLLGIVCAVNTKSAILITGSKEYSEKIRAWQALCLLSRFITPDIVDETFEKAFDAMAQNLHGQIRYFIEVFTIKCAIIHPSVFHELIRRLKSPFLSLQHVSSLMIIAGNILLGSRYPTNITKKSYKEAELTEVVVCVLPWLSSTQGFTRSIAQLLSYSLIPLLLKSNSTRATDIIALQSIWSFLHSNPDMERLRKKQEKFFDGYDVYALCSPEGLLQITVDSGGEPDPQNFVDLMKKCLDEVYLESRECDTPNWKQIAVMADALDDNFLNNVRDSDSLNLQRKIVPLDSLQLSLDDGAKARQLNAAGRKFQTLIVCASLIDKTPNLAGLTRTAEIFAVERLVVPDMKQTLMDNFNSISVGAQDWIKLEECKEENLRQWLNERREDGYTIVGIEQTSSSVNLSLYQFPEKVVLLLGKEKEGIPVELLQLVDATVEVPQLGIIRSLNVHVTGAIAIWEYTKQRLHRRD